MNKEDILEYKGRKGQKVFGLFENVEIGDVPMAVVTEIPVDEALSAATKQLEISVLLLFLTLYIINYFIEKFDEKIIKTVF